MAAKQDWTPRPRILGWVVVNMMPAGADPDDPQAPAAVVASESGYVWKLREDAEESALELRREFHNPHIIAAPILYPDQVKESRVRR